MRRILFTSLLLSLLYAAPAWGQSVAQIEEDDAAPRVVVSPLTYHPPMTGEASSEEVTSALGDGLTSAFRRSHRTDVVDREELVETIVSTPLYAKTVQLGESWATMGIDAYKGLDLDGAVRSLREAIDSFREVGHDLVAPRRFAELLMFLSVSHLERKSQMVEPLDRMQEMILYDPGRVLERGFYPERVVQFYESARIALERDLHRAPDIALNERLAVEVEADYVASAYVFEESGEFEMIGYIWDAATGQALPAESIRLDSLDPDTVRESANRLGTRLIACIAKPDEIVRRVEPSDGSSPLALNVNFAYTSFFTLPGAGWLRPFPNIGASFGAGWSLTREFAIVAMAQIVTSTSEFSNGLLEDFTTLRGFAGTDLGWSFWDFTLGLSTQLEVTKVGDITTCNADIPTKLQTEGQCDEFAESYVSPVFIGVNARPHLSYQLLKSVELQLSASLSYFFVPLNDRELNLPVSGETGLIYRF